MKSNSDKTWEGHVKRTENNSSVFHILYQRMLTEIDNTQNCSENCITLEVVSKSICYDN